MSTGGVRCIIKAVDVSSPVVKSIKVAHKAAQSARTFNQFLHCCHSFLNISGITYSDLNGLEVGSWSGEPLVDGTVDQARNQVFIDFQDVMPRWRQIVSVTLLISL